MLVLPAVIAGPALFFLAGPGVGDHAEIVVGELEVVLRQHPVAILVRVLGQFAVLLQQLGGIAPRAAVDPVELLATALGTVVAAPAPTVIPTIVVQG